MEADDASVCTQNKLPRVWRCYMIEGINQRIDVAVLKINIDSDLH